MGDDGILIGEGVVLDAPPASFATRTLGGLIDLACSLALLWALFVLVAGLAVASGRATAIGGVVVVAAVLIGLPTLVETLSRGRSVGRLAVGLRVVRDDGGAVTFRQALTRALVGVAEIWLLLGVPAVVTSMVHPRGKRLGDLVAGTYAVRVRGGPALRAGVVMPPQLAWWARSADVARLPDGLALAARQFLGRVGRLSPQSRVALGARLTQEVQRYVRPMPPAGTHPEAFLAAVLAERRDRELVVEEARLRRADQDAARVGRLPYGVPDPVD